jgi:hypothetical protein
MNSQKWIATGLCATMVLSIILAPKAARADNNHDDRPVRLVVTDWVDPIGKIAGEFLVNGALTINGRAASADQPIWSGDLLQSRADTSVPVVLDSIGRVTLAKGTVVRLATTRTTLAGGGKRVELVASLAQGEIAVGLQPGASARVRAAGSAFASSRGAVFNATCREGLASIAVKSGDVRRDEEQGSQQHEYTIRPVGHGSNIKVPASGTRQIQLQVVEDNVPVPGVGVLFVLDVSGAINGKLGVGTLSNTTLTVVTNASGVAAVQFVAGPTSGTVPVSATIEGTRTSWTGEITVTSRGGSSHKLGWAIAALIGTGAAAGVAYALTRDKESLQVQPPEVKNP